MIVELLLVAILSVNIVVLFYIPFSVRKTVKDELKRLFEDESNG